MANIASTRTLCCFLFMAQFLSLSAARCYVVKNKQGRANTKPLLLLSYLFLTYNPIIFEEWFFKLRWKNMSMPFLHMGVSQHFIHGTFQTIFVNSWIFGSHGRDYLIPAKFSNWFQSHSLSITPSWPNVCKCNFMLSTTSQMIDTASLLSNNMFM